ARRSARQYDSRILRGIASRTPGRGVGRSAVRRVDGARGRPPLHARVSSVAPGGAHRSAGRGSARLATEQLRRRRRRTDRSAAQRRPYARRMARLPAVLDPPGVRSRGDDRSARAGASSTRGSHVARDALFADLQQFRKDADADLAAALQQELRGATERYQQLKQAAGALDFADLLVRARDLIRDDADVRRHLRQKFARIFVDEFQDTDPIQAEILELLAADVPGKLFIVGDPKQAIYRFRGTDVGTYWDVRDRLEACG